MRSSFGDGNTSVFAGPTKKMAFAKSHIEIHLHNHFRSMVYNTGSPIQGELVIKTQRDTPFDSVQILLLGLTRTKFEDVGSPHVTTNTLLRLEMPVPESTYPTPRILEAGRTYKIPFNFVVPSHLTLNACEHRVEANHVEYLIKARVLRHADVDDNIRALVAREQIKILPTFLEQPPLNAEHLANFYRLSKSKTLRKNLLSHKIGSITASAKQPNAIFLYPDALGTTETVVNVKLVFEPATADAIPPQVTGVSGKILAHTFYSSGAMTNLPDRIPELSRRFLTNRQLSYTATVPLFSDRTQFKTSWTAQLRNTERRDSGYSSSDLQDSKAQERFASPIYHSSEVPVPIRLPSAGSARGGGKTFIPSFASCITSRTYSLQISLTVGGSNSGSTTLALSLPLQIAAIAGVESPRPEVLPDFETAMEDAEVESMLRPRAMTLPDLRYSGNSELPGYA
ncbi:arrestin [Pyricularia oryzae Y34]|uniref:Arrestin n=1 Tax=Pyricularia oryzae (strain Y34) TaxID=1143189 RepID=A0AA97P138_PYRO3|nr:arrestin [Pyricularia oryzae Y34]